MDEVEHMLIRQRHRIQQLYQVPFAFDFAKPQFHNELRAYFNKALDNKSKVWKYGARVSLTISSIPYHL